MYFQMEKHHSSVVLFRCSPESQRVLRGEGRQMFCWSDVYMMFSYKIKFEYALRQAAGTCILSWLSIDSCEGHKSDCNISCFKVGLRDVLPRVLILRCGNT